MYNYSLLNIIKLEKAHQASDFNGCELFSFLLFYIFFRYLKKGLKSMVVAIFLVLNDFYGVESAFFPCNCKIARKRKAVKGER